MTTIKALAFVMAATAFLATPAAAVSVTNTGNQEFNIGVDHGDLEEVKSLAAGKTAKFDCPDGCGVSGPWGYSWMASGDDTLSSDGKSRITAGKTGSAAEGAGSGTAGSAEAGDQ
jgi:hypothetical protein